MDAGLEIFVKDNFGQDKVDLLYESFELFELADIEGVNNRFYEIIMEESNTDVGETARLFEDHAYQTLTDLLRNHGIILVDEASLMMVNQFVDGILNLQYYMGVEDVLRVMESDFDTSEKLVNALMFVTPMEESRALTNIEMVDPSLIDKIEDMFNAKSLDENPDEIKEAIVAKCVNKYRNVYRFLKEADTVAFRLVKANVFIGGEFEEYLPFIAHTFDDMPLQQLGIELFSLMAITKDGVDNPAKCFSAHADQLFGDISHISNINNQINKLVVEFESYIQARRLITKPVDSLIQQTDDELDRYYYPNGKPEQAPSGRSIRVMELEQNRKLEVKPQ